MHWPSYDRTTWGLIIAIAALVLAVPLSIAGNLVTPHLRNWWAERSIATLRKRITKLNAQLNENKQKLAFTDTEDMLFFGVAGTFITIHLFALAAYTVLLPFLDILTKALGPRKSSMLLFPAVLILLMLAVLLLIFYFTFWKFFEERSPRIRRTRADTIARLETKLRQKEKPRIH